MKSVPARAIIAIVAGVLILILPQLTSYLIAAYLVAIGVMAIIKR